jgi:hypothetical protein
VSIRFLADADLNHAIVIGALGREAALNFLTASQTDLEAEAILMCSNSRRVRAAFLFRTTQVQCPSIFSD